MCRSHPETAWSVDLGTTNTVVAVCEGGRVRSVALPGISMPPEDGEEDEYVGGIPSVVELRDARGRHAFIGQVAVDRNRAQARASLARSFKWALARSPERTVAVCQERRI